MSLLLMTPLARQDLSWWRGHDRRMARLLLGLLRRLRDDRPLPAERVVALPLRMPGLFALHLGGEHRLVIERLGGLVIVHQCRFHY